jgi:hypothetical protein
MISPFFGGALKLFFSHAMEERRAETTKILALIKSVCFNLNNLT